MKTYELLLVLDNSVAEDVKESSVKKFEDVITADGGSVSSVEKWGAKKLAYPINYKTEGYYVLITFEAEGKSVKELDRVAGLSAEVLRRVITLKTYTAPAVEPKKAEESKTEVSETVEEAKEEATEPAAEPAAEEENKAE